MSPQQEQLLIPIPGSCAALGGVSRTTLYELVNSGQLVKVNIGRRGFITSKSLAEYVDRLSEAASSMASVGGAQKAAGSGS